METEQTSTNPPQESVNAEPQSLPAKLWHGWIKPMAVAVFVVFTFRSAVADWNDVPSQSMEPTILVGDRIFVNKLAYDLKLPFTTLRLARWSEPQRGDVVVFFSPADGKRMVKRVVGVPGDQIVLRNNRLYLNGGQVDYQTADGTTFNELDLTDSGPFGFLMEELDAGKHAMMVQPGRVARRSFGPVTVPQGQFFVMGDNRDNSGDSRMFGFVPRDQIMGKAVGLAFSLDRDRSFAPRWERFFKGL